MPAPSPSPSSRPLTAPSNPSLTTHSHPSPHPSSLSSHSHLNPNPNLNPGPERDQEMGRAKTTSYYHPYHPWLFALMTACSIAELGLTAFLISQGNETRRWPGVRYHVLLILFCFDSVWTLIFTTGYLLWVIDGSVHLLASIASSVAWLIITTVVWGAASGVMRTTRTGGDCAGQDYISECRQSLTVEALGWSEFALCVVAVLATVVWIQASRTRYRSPYLRLKTA